MVEADQVKSKLTDNSKAKFAKSNGYNTTTLRKKNGETDEKFYQRMSRIGYDLDKVDKHFTDDGMALHYGLQDSCVRCKSKPASTVVAKTGEATSVVQSPIAQAPVVKDEQQKTSTVSVETKPKADATPVVNPPQIDKPEVPAIPNEVKVEPKAKKRGRKPKDVTI